MTVSPEVRTAVRAVYSFRCGYCGISEVWAGSELEIDHFRPLLHGGTDAPDNLVYACTACNRFKGDYWLEDDALDSLRLLHPRQDDFAAHIAETTSGWLIGLTPRGWFHIRRLHLNRPQLIELRQLLQEERILKDAVAQAQDAKAKLQQRILELEAEIVELREIIARLAFE